MVVAYSSDLREDRPILLRRADNEGLADISNVSFGLVHYIIGLHGECSQVADHAPD